MHALQQYFEHLVTFGLVAEHPLEDARTTLRMVVYRYDSHWVGLGLVEDPTGLVQRGGFPKTVRVRLASLGFEPTHMVQGVAPDPMVWTLADHQPLSIDIATYRVDILPFLSLNLNKWDGMLAKRLRFQTQGSLAAHVGECQTTAEVLDIYAPGPYNHVAMALAYFHVLRQAGFNPTKADLEEILEGIWSS
jgi:hypothetical protein